MKPRSSTLFHFTKSESFLFDILENGFWPRYCLEDMQWQGDGKLKFIAFPIVCFCDIPLARIYEHIDFYGGYGIGLTRNWAEKNNLNPILYFSAGSEASKSFSKIMQDLLELSEIDKNKSVDDIRYLIAHTKPSEGNILVDSKPIKKEFYQESEWRFVPKHENVTPFLKQDEFDDSSKLELQNNNSKSYSSLKFLPNDVSYVFVPKDSDIPNIINFMQTKLDHFPSADLKVLFSRVISIESIKRDI